MERRHHLKRHRLRKGGNLALQRGNRFHGLEVVVAGTIGPTGASLVNLLDGRFVQNPSLVELTNRDLALAEVVVELSNDTSHDLLEAGQLVFKVLQGVMENIDLGVLLSNHLTKVATLTKS